MIATLWMLAGLGGAFTQPAPVTTRYRFELEWVSDLDRGPVGGAYVHGVMTITGVVAMSTRDSAGGMVAHFVLDSVSVTPVGAATAVVDASSGRWANGAFIDAFVLRGRIQGTPHESATNPLVHLIVPAIELIYDSDWRKAQHGAAWTDSVPMNFRGSTGNARIGNVIRKWRVVEAAADSAVVEAATVTAWLTDAATDMAGNPMNSRLKFDGTGTVRVVVESNGMVKVANSQSKWETSETSPEMTQGVPGKGSLKIRLERTS